MYCRCFECERTINMSKKRFRAPAAKRAGKRRRKQTPVLRRTTLMQEDKFLDISIDDAVIAQTGSVQSNILLIPEGNGPSERIGRKLVVTRIQARWAITLPATTVAASTSDVVRLMLVLDKQTNGANPNPGGVTGILQADDYNRYRQLTNTGRFVVLMDKFFEMNAQSGGTSAAGVHQFGEVVVQGSYFKKAALPIEYDSSFTTGVIGTIRSNMLHWITWSKSGLCVLLLKSRIRYAD